MRYLLKKYIEFKTLFSKFQDLYNDRSEMMLSLLDHYYLDKKMAFLHQILQKEVLLLHH